MKKVITNLVSSLNEDNQGFVTRMVLDKLAENMSYWSARKKKDEKERQEAVDFRYDELTAQGIDPQKADEDQTFVDLSDFHKRDEIQARLFTDLLEAVTTAYEKETGNTWVPKKVREEQSQEVDADEVARRKKLLKEYLARRNQGIAVTK